MCGETAPYSIIDISTRRALQSALFRNPLDDNCSTTLVDIVVLLIPIKVIMYITNRSRRQLLQTLRLICFLEGERPFSIPIENSDVTHCRYIVRFQMSFFFLRFF